MALLLRSDVRSLVENKGVPCVSIYAPMVPSGPDTLQNRIRFKNVVRQATDRLIDTGMRRPDTEALLQPAHDLLADDLFWQQQSSCLAFFCSPGMSRHYEAPIRSNDLVVAADRFHIKPLLPLLTGDGRFYILALSKNEVRLFEGSRDTVSEIHLQNMPKNLKEVLSDYQTAEQNIERRYQATGPGLKAAVHAIGIDTDTFEKTHTLEYFRRVDRALHELLRDAHEPLVLAGVEYLMSIYQEANTYAGLLPKFIDGNPDKTKKTPEQLHKAAWAIVEPLFKKYQRDALALYGRAAGTNRGSDRLEDILPATHDGRVGILFVAVGTQIWGKANGSPSTLEVHAAHQPGDQDLLNLAAIQTYLTGGTIFALPAEETPDRAPVAAVFRY
jgi:hypothetical protein